MVKQASGRNGGRSRVDEAFDRLREAIETRQLLPGEALRLDALSQELKMSVQPVREAIRLLEAEGLVVRSPNRGAVVAKMPLDEIIELSCIRTIIEPMMVSLATVRASDDDLRAFREGHEAIRQLIEAGASSDSIVRATVDWHLLIYNTAKSRHLSDFTSRVWSAIRINSAWRASRATHTLTEHTEILAAIESRDPHAASAAMRAHLRESVVGHLEGLSGEGDSSVHDAMALYDDMLRKIDVTVPEVAH